MGPRQEENPILGLCAVGSYSRIPLGPQQELNDKGGEGSCLDQLRQLYSSALHTCILLYLPDCPPPDPFLPVLFKFRWHKERVKGLG